MNELLKTLLNRLEDIGDAHQELYDTECRERMSEAIFDGFLKPRPDFVLPSDFGLYSAQANAEVREVVGQYIADAKNRACKTHLRSFHERLAAFQDENIRSDKERLFYDDFFGYWRPENFNEMGELRL